MLIARGIWQKCDSGIKRKGIEYERDYFSRRLRYKIISVDDGNKKQLLAGL